MAAQINFLSSDPYLRESDLIDSLDQWAYFGNNLLLTRQKQQAAHFLLPVLWVSVWEGSQFTCQDASSKGAWKGKYQAVSGVFRLSDSGRRFKHWAVRKNRKRSLGGVSVYFCWVILFSPYGNRLCSDLLESHY